ncbi:M24 family metallopeptidase [Paenibacillus tarimensis]|uniref:M24 family metallopeptidase n=1 Tax=Paenibacillus tarimensis TaxID=416012 RepID=UPI001F1B17B4|nr:Xaa-Pro peptidase family protein [Paenibacillus tarimensis]MCF2942420.1 Xaa-Pro peptidase family protein [Paenibacillus tarimensis]
MKQRIDKLRAKLENLGLDAILVASDVNRAYLSGFTGSAGMLLITGTSSYLLTDFRYMTQAPEQAKDYKVVEHAQNWLDTVKELAGNEQITKLGFEENHVVHADYLAWSEALAPVTLHPTGGVVEDLRIIKEPGEIVIMQEACELADAAFKHILGFIETGRTELELSLELEWFMRRNGASAVSFTTIVASGERSALPHGVASSRKIGRDEFIKFDFGALYKGYCSDITRTVVYGTPSDKHKEIYNIVLEAQLYALEHIKPGMTGREADALTRDIITRYGYGEFFGHGTGHGLGMEIHEAPRLSLKSDTILTPGMTVTVEPGIYIPQFGGVRIEDDIVITDTGIKILTSSPKELTVLG